MARFTWLPDLEDFSPLKALCFIVPNNITSLYWLARLSEAGPRFAIGLEIPLNLFTQCSLATSSRTIRQKDLS